LESFVRMYGIERFGQAHTAGSDALVTLDLYFCVVQSKSHWAAKAMSSTTASTASSNAESHEEPSSPVALSLEEPTPADASSDQAANEVTTSAVGERTHEVSAELIAEATDNPTGAAVPNQGEGSCRQRDRRSGKLRTDAVPALSIGRFTCALRRFCRYKRKRRSKAKAEALTLRIAWAGLEIPVVDLMVMLFCILAFNCLSVLINSVMEPNKADMGIGLEHPKAQCMAN